MATTDAAKLAYDYTDLFDLNLGAMGYGVTWGYDSVIGPMEISVMGSNYRNISLFVSLGFWF